MKQPELSIVVVSYNGLVWLDQSLWALQKATTHLRTEVFVVDNASSDGSAAWVNSHFPGVHVIANPHNPGFGTANNQALHRISAPLVLLLNPDTLVTESNIQKALEWMHSDPEIGSMGCRMVDGTGVFLPESKRGMPTPWVAFAKVFGLSALFPKHPVLGRYHWGLLKEEEDGPVDVHCGAWMLIRTEALHKAGLFDEIFFMYGEDIDLSYRIIQSGYKNVYLGSAPILHYKGESTKKGSLNYVKVFYKAMVLFANKHFAPRAAAGFGLFIWLGVLFRAALSFGKRIVQSIAWPLVDLSLWYGGFRLLIAYWEENHRYASGGHYPDSYLYGMVPLYLLLWCMGWLWSGTYKRPVRLSRLMTGWVLGTSLTLVLYALLPEEMRFSRALILLGAVWALASSLFARLLASLFPFLGIGWLSVQQRRVLHVRSAQALSENWPLMSPPTGAMVKWEGVCTPEQLPVQLSLYGATEILFYPEELLLDDIVSHMIALKGLRFRNAYPSRGWIIGSDSKNTQGKTSSEQLTGLFLSEKRRTKRQGDLFLSVVFLLLSPVLMITHRGRSFLSHWPSVVVGKESWVGDRQCAVPAVPLKNNASPAEWDDAFAVYKTHWEAHVDWVLVVRTLLGR